MASIDFQALFEASPNLYMVIDRELRFVTANAAYCRAVAARLEDLVGRPLFELFPHDPDDPKNASARLLRESFARVFETGQPDTIAHIVYRVPSQTPEGVRTLERVWSATHTPIRDAQGHVVNLLQHTVDVTEVQALGPRSDPTASPSAIVQAGLLQRSGDVQAANASLVNERRHLRNIFEQTPGFLAILRGKDHVFELVNAAYYQLVGHRQLVGLAIRDALPEIAGQGFFELLDGVYATGEPFVGRGVLAKIQRTPDGPPTEMQLDLVYQPISDDDGVITGILVQGHDITGQRNAERERERLATIVERSSDCIAVASLDGRFVYLNDAGKTLLGITRETLATTAPIEAFLPEDRAFVMETVYPTLMAKGRWEGDFRHRHVVTGEAIAVRYNVFTILDPGSTDVVAFASVSRDMRVTNAQESALAFLHEAERSARALSEVTQIEHRFLNDAIPDQIWTAAPDGNLTHVNLRVVHYFGRSAEELIGGGWLSVVHPEDVAKCSESWARVLPTGEPYECEFRLLRARDQSYRWHIARALCLRDELGRIVKWFGSNTDIDDLKRTEHERDSLILALSASNFELDQFAYVASHDLKAPLRGIANLAQWIEADIGDQVSGETRDHLTMMQRRVVRMDALIDGVLNYSRAGRSKTGTEVVDVGAMLAEVIELLSSKAGVTVEIGPGMPRLQTVAVALQQVFMNLVGNALKHARRDDPVVRIEAHDVPGPRRMVHFSVKDNGPGIDPQFHERIWALFQVLQPRDEVEGSGIGLAVVKKLVEARGGQVGVESKPGEGATFWFTWPRLSS